MGNAASLIALVTETDQQNGIKTYTVEGSLVLEKSLSMAPRLNIMSTEL
jgi:hypothetical protein